MNKKIFLAGLLCLASVASVVGTVGNAHEVEAATINGHIYFEKPSSWTNNGDGNVYLVVGHNGWNAWYKMDKISNTGLYHYQITNWQNATAMAFVVNSSKWADNGESITSRIPWVDGHHCFIKEDFPNNSTKCFMYADTNENAAKLKVDSWSNLNYEISTSCDGGGTASVSGYALSNYNTTSLSEKEKVSIAYNTSATLTATASEGYEFVGWYDGANQISTSTTYTVNNVTAAKTYTAKFNALQTSNPDEEVKTLLNSYYNNGLYTRKTTININKEAVEDDLARKYNDNTNTYESLFHAKAILLERTTYFNEDALWMSNEETDEKGTYSYYGTKYDGDTPVGVTGGRVPLNETTSNVVLSGKGKESMENYYTTMYDLLNNEANWVKDGNGFSTEDSNVIKMFLDFTAPCFLNLNNNEINNYFSLDHVEVEETINGLELRLVTTGDSGKLTENANNVLSVATITTK